MPFVRLYRENISAVGHGDEVVSPYAHQTVFFPFVRHNWVEELLIETSWSTQVSASGVDHSEERRGLWDRPQRSIALRVNGNRLDSREMSRIYLQMMRHTQQTLPAPLTCDRTVLQSDVALGETDCICDLSYKRFFPGMRIGIVKADYSPFQIGNVLTDAYIATTHSILENGIRLYENAEVFLPAGSWVFPMMDVEPVFSINGQALSDRFVDYRIEFIELSGASAIPSSWPLGSEIQSKFYYYEGKPIFSFRPDVVSNPRIGYIRQGSRNNFGRGTHFTTEGEAASLSFSFLLTTKTREDSWKILNFMDWSQGRLKTFWMRNPHIYWRYEDGVISGTLTELIVETYFSHVETSVYFQYLFIQFTNGFQQVVKVSSVSTGGAANLVKFTLQEAPVQDYANIKFITSAHLVRNQKDAFRQSWITDSVATSYIDVIEVTDEDDEVTIS